MKQTAKRLLNTVGLDVRRYKPSTARELESGWTDYLNWLKYAVAGMLSKGNVDAMSYAMQRLPSSAPMLEIGSFCGLSTLALTYLREKHGKTNVLFTCDRWQFEGADSGPMLGDSKHVTHAAYREFVRSSYIRNVTAFAGHALPFTIELFSDEFFQQWNAGARAKDVFGRSVTLGGPLSFCFIDGNHTYEFAKRDFENTDRVLVRGGFILFDDSADGSEWEVCGVVREAVQSGRYEIVSNNPNYMLRKK